MPELTREETLIGMRQIIDFLERPENALIPVPYGWADRVKRVYVFATDDLSVKERFKSLVGVLRASAPDAVQTIKDGQVTLSAAIGPFSFALTSWTDQICERKQVGTRVIPERVTEAVDAYTEPEHEEPIYEYECLDKALSAK